MSIKQNEIFTILGHNGAGKTTAINMLTGMLKTTSGTA
jgi:ABC-type multidrug transport system ATPase subunit